jgi:hypothetical protein
MSGDSSDGIRASIFCVLLVGGLVLTGCDLSSSTGTVILNANSSVPPIVEYRFRYTQEDATSEGRVDVGSMIESETLDDILATNGVTREQVVSARVDSVRVDPVSTTSLSAADLHLGTDVSGPRIAQVAFSSEGGDPVFDRSPTTVTGAVKAGESRAFGRFQVDDPSRIPSGGSVVRATVYFRIEAE